MIRMLSALALGVLISLSLAACGGRGGETATADLGVDAGSDAAVDRCVDGACPTGTTCNATDGLCHCGAAGSGPVCTTTLPAAVCTVGTRWNGTEQAFEEATSDFRLDSFPLLNGGLMSVGDIDGDGWADVAVPGGGVRFEDFTPGAMRYTFLLRNDHMGHFIDVTEESGILQTRLPHDGNPGRPGEVWAFGDVDNDGDLDVYTGCNTSAPTMSMGETSELMINDGTGHFTLGPEDSDVRAVGYNDTPAGAAFTDFDRDGNLDLFVAQFGYSNYLLRSFVYKGDGTGHFTDVTSTVFPAGVFITPITTAAFNSGHAFTRSWSAAACDANNDGTPDLLAASYGRAPNGFYQGVRAEDGTTSFTNRSVESGYAYDQNQMWQMDLNAQCYCRDNPGDANCAGVTPASVGVGCVRPWDMSTDTQPFRLGGNSGATICRDIDNDGDMDLLTTEIAHWDTGPASDLSEVLVNGGETDPVWTRPGRAAMGIVVAHISGWNEGIISANMFDFDNDGWQDFYWGGSEYAGNHGMLFHQDSALMFSAVPINLGIDHHRSNGVVSADFDHDGDQDAIVGHSLSRCDPAAPDNCYATAQVRFFRNIYGQDGNWIQLDLEGITGTNRDAIGARVSVTAGGVTQTQEVVGGYGHYGANDDHALQFGLGTACSALVTIRWPDTALTTTSYTLPAGHRYHIVQGTDPLYMQPDVSE